MSNLTNKHIILGVTGGIAAYKTPDIVRRLRDRGAVVRVVMTDNAKAFITPLTLQAVSHHPVHDNLLDEKAEAAMGHIELARWADAILIAPATANSISQLAEGKASGLLSTLCLASKARKVLAPAMNQQMWRDAATAQNIKTLKQRDYTIIGPAEGSQACGDVGPGRMLEAADIAQQLEGLFVTGELAGLKVLMTAGPTVEPIDPVRFLSNHSSGRMAYALAQACIEANAQVTLVSGPTNLPAPPKAGLLTVRTAEEMYAKVMNNVESCDIFIAVAAVADYRVKKIHLEKIKKSNENMLLELIPNPDIVKSVANLPKSRPFVVGFAAETSNLLGYAKDKLKQKNLDMIIANPVGLQTQGFASDKNEVSVLWPQGEKSIPLTRKEVLARELVTIIANYYYEKHPIKNT